MVEMPPLHVIALEVAVADKGAFTSVVVNVFHLSSEVAFPSPLVAFPATLKVTVALPVAGAVQLKVHEVVPVGAALGVECRISVAPFKAVPVTAVKEPEEACISNPSLNPEPAGVIVVFEIVSVKLYTVPLKYPPAGKPEIRIAVVAEEAVP